MKKENGIKGMTDMKAFLYDCTEACLKFGMINAYNREKIYKKGFTKMSQMEIHILTYIADHPGVTATELVQYWGRTKGAISQTVKKLKHKKLVYTVQKEEDAKIQKLFATDEGVELSEAHKEYDIQNVTRTLLELKKDFTDEEIDVFYSIMRKYTEILRAKQRGGGDKEK